LKFLTFLFYLLNLPNLHDLEGHPKMGASWEGFVIQQIVRQIGARSDECYFWATHTGAELDLFVIRGRQRLGFEIKRTSAPRITPSMRNALADLKLQHFDVIHAGDVTFQMDARIRAVALSRLIDDLQPLR
jgi:predicted AAA+ superfamily ATPase